MNKTIAPAALLLASLFCGTAHAQVDNVLSCNGRTDLLQASAHLATANTFTMEAWVFPMTSHQIDRPSQQGYAGMNGQHYAIYPTHGTKAWGAGHAGAGISVGTNGITVYEHAEYHMPAVLTYQGAITEWTHVAVVYRDGTPSLYVNGDLVETGRKSPMKQVHPGGGNSNEHNWQTGGIGGGPYGYFEGALDNVRVWNRALDEHEVRMSMDGAVPNATGLALNYDMNRSGRGRDLTVASGGSLKLSATTIGTATTPVFEPRTTVSAISRATTGDPSEISIEVAPRSGPPVLLEKSECFVRPASESELRDLIEPLLKEKATEGRETLE